MLHFIYNTTEGLNQTFYQQMMIRHICLISRRSTTYFRKVLIMSRKKNVSLRFIADKCGVSTATVSRVLNNDSRVTAETRLAVLKVLDEYDYTAPPLKDPNVRKIGCIITSSYAEYYQALLRNVGIYFRHRGIATVAVNTESTEGYLRTALETLYDCNVSGIILIGCDYLTVKDYLSKRFPHVWIDCNDPSDQTENICTVESDQFVAGQLAAHEFLRHGCKRPIILCGSHSSHRNERRINGFTAVYRDNGLNLSDEQIVKLPEMRPHVTEGKDIIQYLITKGMEFDGIFAISDGRAIGCYMGLQKMGKRIPEDIKLMAFDGIAEANISVLGITSIQQNVELLAKSACELLLKQIRNEKIEERHVLVPAGVLPGQTM